LKKVAALFAVLATGLVAVACGSDEEKVTPETLAAAMDEVCTETNPAFDDLGTRGLDNPGLVLEFEGSADVRREMVAGFEEIDADAEARKQLDEYIAATQKIIESDEAIVGAAGKGDDAAVNEAFEEATVAIEKRDAIAGEIGTKVCGKPADIKVVATETAPPEDLEYARPGNTIEDAADSFVTAIRSGKCARINATRHTDAGELDGKSCQALADRLGTGEVEGTEQFGPAGQAEIVAGDGTRYAFYFANDLDGNLRYGGDAIHDQGGLRPAPDVNDSQAVADAVVSALRNDDVEAFNATLPSEETGFHVKGDSVDSFSKSDFVKPFLADVRATDQEPVQLGLSAAFGFYFLPGEENDWLIATIHKPGAGGKYAFSGYYPIPKAG